MGEADSKNLQGVEKRNGEGMMQLDKEKRESMIRFMMVLMIFGFAIFLKNYLERMESYNTTILAFTYQYGFISRGFLGTAYLLLDKLLPWNLMKYKMVLRVTVIATSIFMMLFYWFIWICMKRCSRKYLVNLQYCFLFLTISVVSMFYSKRNLGRPDVYMLFLTLICVILVIYEKAEFLLVPASAICVMMHQGYVFMFFNILLVLLAIRILETTGMRRRYYIWILGLSFVICSGLFVYFEFFSHGGGEEIYDSIVSVATELSRGGKYHETLIAHEILGVDLFETEWPQHISNFIELPLYLLCMSPYLVLGVRYMRRVLRAADSRQKKLSYWLLILGGGTLLPDFILKIDYGRWLFALLMYFAIVLFVLIARGDELLAEQLHVLMNEVKTKWSWSMMLLIYPALFNPFYDVHICQLLRNITNPLNEAFWHIWQ